MVGNYAAADPHYGYAALKGRQAHRSTVRDFQLPLEEVEGQVGGQWGATYISFPVAGNLEVAFSTAGRFQVWAYAWQGGKGVLQEVGLDAAGQGHFAGVGIDSLTLIAGRLVTPEKSFLLSADYFIPTLVADLRARPLQMGLGTGYPNPFNGEVQIPFVLAETQDLDLAIYNNLGQRVRLLQAGRQGPGAHQVVWDGRDAQGLEMGSGTYTVVMQAGGSRQSRRLSLIK